MTYLLLIKYFNFFGYGPFSIENADMPLVVILDIFIVPLMIAGVCIAIAEISGFTHYLLATKD